MGRTATVVLPDGYATAEEFAKDIGLELVPVCDAFGEHAVPDAVVTMVSNKWVAAVSVSPNIDEHGFVHAYARTSGTSEAEARSAAQYVLWALGFGRETFIRTRPEANSETDFRTKITRHSGFVRFSFKLERGEWHWPNEEIQIPSVGQA